MLRIGDMVPELSLESSNGGKRSLKDFLGKKVVLYFYPKDNTPGCTMESCAFRDKVKDYHALNAVIIGVSKDSLKSHEKFINKFNLPFELLSDPESKLAEAFGCWKEKSMFGKKYMGIVRSTFLIDEEGKIQKEWRKVKVNGHVDAVLQELTE